MEVIILALGAGLLIGYFELLPQAVLKLTDQLVLGGLFLLLFTMGLQIGADQQIVTNLNHLGLQAFILASGAVVGSILVILLFKIVSNRGH
ncbi:LysO family transporter [Halanaerobaculum tunisiense]